MDVPTSIRVADLRREIEGIQELNRIYHFQRHHTHLDRAAFERRKARLEQIKQELTALRPSPRLVSNRYNER
jgi:hypothetical protein